MGSFTDKIKAKVKDVKDAVAGAGEETKDFVADKGKEIKDTVAGAGEEPRRGSQDDPLTSYKENEPMTPAKIKEHEPTAVKREMTEKITESGQTGTSPEEAAEIARKKGMAKGTAGATETTE